MKKFNQVYVIGLFVIGAALSGCGRNDYNGTFTGTVTAGQGSSASNIYGNPNGYSNYNNYNAYSAADTATLKLTQNGQQVQGSYSTMNGDTGTFYASATTSSQLSNIQLNLQQYNGNTTTGFNTMPTGTATYCGGTYYSGNLTSTDSAREIDGTLNAAGGTNVQNPLCGSKTFRLIKMNNS